MNVTATILATLADMLRSLGFDDGDLATVPIHLDRKDV